MLILRCDGIEMQHLPAPSQPPWRRQERRLSRSIAAVLRLAFNPIGSKWVRSRCSELARSHVPADWLVTLPGDIAASLWGIDIPRPG